MNPSRGAGWEKLRQMFLVGFSALVNSKCAQGNDSETNGNHEEGSERVRSSDGAPRSGRGDRRAEPSREPSQGSNRAGPSGYPGFRAGNGQAEATGRRAGGQDKQSVFFWQFCDVAKSDDDPQEDLAIFGYNLKMKAIRIEKNPSIFFSYLLEPCI